MTPRSVETTVSNGPDSGLADAVLIAMILIVAVPALLMGVMGYRVARGRQLHQRALIGITVASTILGGLLGTLAIALTFF